MEKHKFKIFKVKNVRFIFKLDINPVTNEYDYHIYLRHLVTPEQAIAAYFNKTHEVYNDKYDRYEAICDELKIVVYYTYLKQKDIMLITAFYCNEGVIL